MAERCWWFLPSWLHPRYNIISRLSVFAKWYVSIGRACISDFHIWNDHKPISCLDFWRLHSWNSKSFWGDGTNRNNFWDNFPAWNNHMFRSDKWRHRNKCNWIPLYWNESSHKLKCPPNVIYQDKFPIGVVRLKLNRKHAYIWSLLHKHKPNLHFLQWIIEYSQSVKCKLQPFHRHRSAFPLQPIICDECRRDIHIDIWQFGKWTGHLFFQRNWIYWKPSEADFCRSYLCFINFDLAFNFLEVS